MKRKIDIIDYLTAKGLFNFLPDELYLKMRFRKKLHRSLNLNNPLTFNEKIQWLKLYDRKAEYTQMVDKYEAKAWAAKRIGNDYIVPTLGIWDRFDAIDFEQLPEQFVLKCTHDSGGSVICRSKSTFDQNAARKKLEKALKTNYYLHGREWPYKHVKPRLLAEQYLEDPSSKQSTQGITDYKFYCFSGKPKFLYLSQGLEDHASARISFVDLNWQFSPYRRSDYPPFDQLPPKPACFDEMVALAERLSEGLAFLRVDLYQIDGRVFFSELTFSPCSGLMPFENPEHDAQIGRMLTLATHYEQI